ncbi:hypothetical protein [Geodermatophilus sp. SYSU D01105]
MASAAINALRPRLADVGAALPDRIHVSVGFGFGTRPRAGSREILGQT